MERDIERPSGSDLPPAPKFLPTANGAARAEAADREHLPRHPFVGCRPRSRCSRHRPSHTTRRAPPAPARRRCPSPRSRPIGARSRSSPAATSGRCRPRAAKRACSCRTPRTIRGRSIRPTERGSRSCRRAPGNGDIYVLTLATGQLKRITFDDAPDQLDAWSRDGQWLYLSSGSQDVNGMNDIFRVSVEGGTPMAVSADRFTQEYWSAPSPTDAEHARVHRDRAARVNDWWRQGHSHIDESQIWLVRIGGDDAARTRRSRRTTRAPRGRCGAPTARRCTSCRIESGVGEHLGQAGRAAATPRARDDVQGRARGLADDRVRRSRRSCSSATSASGRSTSRAARRARCRSRCAARATAPVVEHQTLTQGFQWLALVARRQEGRVRRRTATSSPRRRATAATRRASRRRRSWRRSSRGRPTAGGWRTSRSRDGPTHVFVYDFGARTETKLTDGALNDVAPTLVARRQVDRVRCAARKELRVIDVATKQDRVLATGELDRPPFLPTGDRLVARRTVDRLPERRARAQFQNPHVVAVDGGGRAARSAFLPNANRRHRSRGARTARICCSTRRSARSKGRWRAST